MTCPAEAAASCTHCGLCRRSCVFLQKYGIVIGDVHRLEKLAWHCFLCGRCTEVCPRGIDGRGVVLDLRRRRVRAADGRLPERGYGLLMWEKGDYKFRNYRNARGFSALFPGCSFPSFYPETARRLAALLREKAGMGVVFDCCGKPVAELGLEAREARLIDGLNARLNACGITEIATVCPNCYYFLKGRLDASVVSVYDKLRPLLPDTKISDALRLFISCPDRTSLEFFKSFRPFLSKPPRLLSEHQCCGLGGGAAVREPELARQMPHLADHDAPLFTYCASCGGSLARKGFVNGHVLSELLGCREKPDGAHSLLNRIKTKFWRAETHGKKRTKSE